MLDAIAEGSALENQYRIGILRRDDLEAAVRNKAKECLTLMGLVGKGEVVFASSGVEAINTAVKGIAWGREGATIGVVQGDPDGFWEAAAWCERLGHQVEKIPLTDGGAADISAFVPNGNTIIAASTVTPEVFVPRDVRTLSELGSSGGRILDVTLETEYRNPAHSAAFADAVTIDGAAIGGPLDSGVVWFREGTRVAPLISGGEEQGGRRGGRISLGSVFGLVAALHERLDPDHQARNMELFTSLHAAALQELARIDGVVIPWVAAQVPLGLTFVIPGVEGEAVVELANQAGVLVASGSPCSKSSGKPSAVLTGLGFSQEEASSAIHIHFREDHTTSSIAQAISVIADSVETLRRMAG